MEGEDSRPEWHLFLRLSTSCGEVLCQNGEAFLSKDVQRFWTPELF